MSSSGGTVAREHPVDAVPWPDQVRWIWPAGARGVLAVTACAFALWLATASGGGRPSEGVAIVAAPTLRLDANSAPPQVLGALPHLGPALVRQFVRARESRPLESLEDAGRRVRGLGPGTRAQLAPHLRFEPVARGGLGHAEGLARVAQPRVRRRMTAPLAKQLPASRDRRLAGGFRAAETTSEISLAQHD
jgi:competence protein ComEA